MLERLDGFGRVVKASESTFDVGDDSGELGDVIVSCLPNIRVPSLWVPSVEFDLVRELIAGTREVWAINTPSLDVLSALNH